jgi:hypothetical protein
VKTAAGTALTRTVCCTDVVTSSESVTVRVTVLVPLVGKACCTLAPLAAAPSPKSHRKPERLPSASEEADPSKVTVCPICGTFGDHPKAASGGELTGASCAPTGTCGENVKSPVGGSASAEVDVHSTTSVTMLRVRTFLVVCRV